MKEFKDYLSDTQNTLLSVTLDALVFVAEKGPPWLPKVLCQRLRRCPPNQETPDPDTLELHIRLVAIFVELSFAEKVGDSDTIRNLALEGMNLAGADHSYYYLLAREYVAVSPNNQNTLHFLTGVIRDCLDHQARYLYAPSFLLQLRNLLEPPNTYDLSGLSDAIYKMAPHEFALSEPEFINQWEQDPRHALELILAAWDKGGS